MRRLMIPVVAVFAMAVFIPGCENACGGGMACKTDKHCSKCGGTVKCEDMAVRCTGCSKMVRCGDIPMTCGHCHKTMKCSEVHEGKCACGKPVKCDMKCASCGKAMKHCNMCEKCAVTKA